MSVQAVSFNTQGGDGREKPPGPIGTNGSISRMNTNGSFGTQGSLDSSVSDARLNEKVVCNLVTHGLDYDKEELVLNAPDFPFLKKDDIVEVYHEEAKYNRVLLQVRQLNTVKGFKVSILKSVAEKFNLRRGQDVVVALVDPQKVGLDFIELSFKEQFIARSDQWFFRTDLGSTKTIAYKGKIVEWGGMRAQIDEMLMNKDNVSTGVITQDTKLIFRSRSAKMIWMFQMSLEMWEFADDGQMYFERGMNFIKSVMERWKVSMVNHTISIVFFSRTYYPSKPELPPSQIASLQRSDSGRYYQDFYKVVLDMQSTQSIVNSESILVTLKKEFNNYLSTTNIGEPYGGQLSAAAAGNFIEAANLVANIFQNHPKDRDLSRTNMALVAVTGGTGLFETTKTLTQLTKQRMFDQGVGCDLISVRPRPLHTVPLFAFEDPETAEPCYNSPGWINVGFIDFLGRADWEKPSSLIGSEDDKFHPCCGIKLDQKASDAEAYIQPGSFADIAVRSQNSDEENDCFADHDRKVFEQCLRSSSSASDLQSMKSSKSVSNFADMAGRAHSGSDPRNSSLGVSRSFGMPSYLIGAHSPDTYQEGKQSPTRGSFDTLAHAPYASPGRAQKKKSAYHKSILPVVPFEPAGLRQNGLRATTNRRRWIHVFRSLKSGITELVGKSLVAPAVLPVTTDYFPTSQELEEEFVHSLWSLTVDPEVNYPGMTINLLRELVCQRLQLEFQLAVTAAKGDDKSRQVYQMSKGHQIHVLIYDAVQDSVEVRRYLRKADVTKNKPRRLSYSYCVWERYGEQFLSSRAVFKDSNDLEQRLWNELDQKLFSHSDQDEIGHHLKFIYRRIRFALIPPEDATDFAKRIASFSKFIEYVCGKATTSGLDRDGGIQVHVETTAAEWEDFEQKDATDKKVRLSRKTTAIPHEFRTVKIELHDPKIERDDSRYEWLVLQYESVFNPATIYHLEVDFVACSGVVVDDFVQMCLRRAKQCGSALLQVPVNDRGFEFEHDPFDVKVRRPFYSDVRKLFEEVLQSRFDFIESRLEVGATESAYLHRSGGVIVRMTDQTFEWENNQLCWKADIDAIWPKVMELKATLEMTRDIIDGMVSDMMDNLPAVPAPVVASPVVAEPAPVHAAEGEAE